MKLQGKKVVVTAAAQGIGRATAEAFAVVQTGERRFYGNILLTKGVVPPDAPA